MYKSQLAGDSEKSGIKWHKKLTQIDPFKKMSVRLAVQVWMKLSFDKIFIYFCKIMSPTSCDCMDYLRDCAVHHLRYFLIEWNYNSLYFGISNSWLDANNCRCKAEGITAENLDTTKEVKLQFMLIDNTFFNFQSILYFQKALTAM